MAGIIAIVVVVTVLALLGGIVLGSSSGEEAQSDSASSVVGDREGESGVTTRQVPTESTTTPATLEALAIELDEILHRSADGREAIVEVIGGVVAECRYDPNEASDRIGAVLENRESIRDELLALDTVDAEGARVVAQLDSALSASIESNEHYLDWVRGSYSVSRQDPIGCTPPQDADFLAAVEDSDRATAAKQDFVAVYDPLARRYGLRTWSDTEF